MSGNVSDLSSKHTCEIVFLIDRAMKSLSRDLVDEELDEQIARMILELNSRGLAYRENSEWVNGQLAEYHLLFKENL